LKQEEVIRKIQAVVSRIDKAVFLHIDAVLLFGSSLYKEDPHDVDLLVVAHQTPEDLTAWREYFHKVVFQLPLCEHSAHAPESKTAIALRAKMKGVDIHVATSSLDIEIMATKCFLLAWYPKCPNVLQNLKAQGYGTPLTKKLGKELASLRAQLKERNQEKEVLERVCWLMKEGLTLKEKADVAIHILSGLSKKEVSEERIREILKRYGFPEQYITAYRVKGYKVSWEFTEEAKKVFKGEESHATV
jgi:hypothetical protein